MTFDAWPFSLLPVLPAGDRPSFRASAPREDFAERLRTWRARHNLTQAEAAGQLDINRSYLSQVEGGRAPGNGLRTRFTLVEKGPPGRPTSVPANGLRHLPVLSWSQAGQLLDLNRIPPPGNEVVPSELDDERAFGVRLRGDAMEPRFFDGDIAILVPGEPSTTGDVVIANLREQGLLCRLLHATLDRNFVKLSSYNPAYPLVEYHRRDFHWIAPVATIVRQLRRA